MKVDVQPGDILARADEAVVVNLFEGVAKPGGATGAVDAALGGGVAEAIRLGDFRGKKGEVLWLRPAGKIPAKRVLVVGLGEKRGFGMDEVRQASAKAAQAVRDAGV
jgi:leucyl aminopeptidase